MELEAHLKIIKTLSKENTFGGVYLVFNKKTKDLLVYKNRSLEKLIKEFDVLSKCKGDGVLDVIELNQSSNALIFPYYQGSRTLLSLSKDELPLLIRVIHKVIKVLKYIHSKGFVHADIKPSNILVLPNEEIKIIDFGAAIRIGTRFVDMQSFEVTPKEGINTFLSNNLDQNETLKSYYINKKATPKLDWEALKYYLNMSYKIAQNTQYQEDIEKLLQELDVAIFYD